MGGIEELAPVQAFAQGRDAYYKALKLPREAELFVGRLREELRVALAGLDRGLGKASKYVFYFAHPESRYLSLGKIDHDQVLDYRARKGMSAQEIERWLSRP